jgi:hypothetical protein
MDFAESALLSSQLLQSSAALTQSGNFPIAGIELDRNYFAADARIAAMRWER